MKNLNHSKAAASRTQSKTQAAMDGKGQSRLVKVDGGE
jgi:hypothetical protein